MYITKGESIKGYEVSTETNGSVYNMDYKKLNPIGTSPVGLLNSALVGCIIMVIRSYFSIMGMDVKVEAISKLDGMNIEMDIKLDIEVSEAEIQRILAYVEEKCTVHKMISKEVKIIKNIRGI
ncbi:OsmC family protein [Streptobacillus moniliformis]|uniref:OsmC family protein n=1 Tax=Streptobacillus moniliformis (strain ATCC 14647 / DSM 12112 / NCTC 10651 / 9901) TaxID=519441 RepID=D1AWE7_STRM9|nr:MULTISPECIES: OsmC family protein [Streptobacillus]ACZ00623.1 OsmC family protein [Streptobacillus moniliformis DSM 12112]AVL42966.1 OsmC family peroxiredoxin [Streptobacillus moniliformis]QXW65390.1 OsmC family protein [Streptobacillus moniliformis]SQA14251.1 OsmC-like protein [Streptobacillus moniliformis]